MVIPDTSLPQCILDVKDLIEETPIGDRMLEVIEQFYKDSDKDYFSCAEALYWFCSDWYNGQYDPMYSIICTLGFKPGFNENGPLDSALDLYDELSNIHSEYLGRHSNFESNKASGE